MSKLYVVATPIGNISDISPRATEILSSVDLIFAEDTRTSGKLLAMLGIEKAMASYHKFNEEDRAKKAEKMFLVEEFSAALITDAGTPAISDPGSVLVKTAREAGAQIIAVPGPSAVIAALSVSGFLNTAFCFRGFFPRKQKERRAELEHLKAFDGLTAYYESPLRIREALKCVAEVLGADTEVSVSKEITKMFEKTVSGRVSRLIFRLDGDEYAEKGEYVFIINNNSIKKEYNENSELSLEGMIADTAAKKNCSLKEAVKFLKESDKNLKKSELYDAALRLKGML